MSKKPTPRTRGKGGGGTGILKQGRKNRAHGGAGGIPEHLRGDRTNRKVELKAKSNQDHFHKKGISQTQEGTLKERKGGIDSLSPQEVGCMARSRAHRPKGRNLRMDSIDREEEKEQTAPTTGDEYIQRP